MNDQKKDQIDTKGPKQRNHAKQLQTHNFPTDDVENINSTNKGRVLLQLTCHSLFPNGQKGCCNGKKNYNNNYNDRKLQA